MSQEEFAATPKPTSRVSVAKWILVPLILVLVATQVWLFYRVSKLEEELTTTQSVIAQARSSIATLERKMAYVIPLAENANRYAHSHYSDMRLKKDIADITDPLKTVLALRGVRFRWNSQVLPALSLGDEPQIGFIAQEVEQVCPELVTTAHNGYKMVDYAELTPLLVEAIKEQQAIINSLEQRVSALEALQ